MRTAYDPLITVDAAIVTIVTTRKKGGPGRKPVFTKPVRKRFLERMSLGDRPTIAARNVGVSYSTVQRYVRKNPKFARKMREAQLPAIERIEDAAYKACVEDRNPTMLIFMLANLASDRFKRDPDKSVLAQVNVSGGQSVEWTLQDARARLHGMVDELEAKRQQHEQAAIEAESREVEADGR